MSNGRTSSAATVGAVLLLVAVQNSFTHAAGAEKYNTVTLKTMSPDDLKKCGASGGTFENLGSDWSCSTKKGSVSCNAEQCTGVTPAASAPTPKHLRDPGPVLDSLSAQ